MELDSYRVFYMENGIRRRGDLNNPKIHDGLMILPKNSLFHYIGNNINDVGPTRNTPMFAYTRRHVYVEHTTKYDGVNLIGGPRMVAAPYQTKIDIYHRQNILFKKVIKSVGNFTDPQHYVVCSYTGLYSGIAYKANVLSRYYEWYNRYAAIWANIKKVSKEAPMRNQFVVIEVPDNIPSLSFFQKTEKRQDLDALRPFLGTDGHMNIMDLFWWTGENRSQSHLNGLTTVQMNQINLIFTYKGKWVVINLGLLNGWISQKDLTDEEGNDVSIKGLDQFTMQKNFLHFLLNFTNMEVETVSSNPSTTLGNVTSSLPISGATSVSSFKPITLDMDLDQPSEQHLMEEPSQEEIDVDKSLELHEKLYRESETAVAKQEQSVEKAEAIKAIQNPNTAPIEVEMDLTDTAPYYYVEQPLEHAPVQKAKAMVENGVLSVIEYNKLVEMTESYKSIPVPRHLNIPASTVGEMLGVTMEDLKLTGNQTIRDNDTVTDKSYLKSTLLTFDKEYIEKNMYRHVMEMIASIQKRGIVIQDIQFVQKTDIVNDFQTFVVKAIPIGGKISTLNIDIPRVTERGIMKSGGVETYMKKQQGDMPIRKIAPNRVALSSYYPTKLFIDRSEYVVHDYTYWIGNKIALIGQNPANDLVYELRSSPVMEKGVRLPRVYTAIASRFSGFKSNRKTNDVFSTIDFVFDYNRRLEYFGEAKSKSLEGKYGMVIVGSSQNGYVLVDKTNTFYGVNNLTDAITPLGTIEDILGIDTTKKPNDIAVVNLFGKNVPLVVMLIYKLGLKKLLKTLNLTPRRVSITNNRKLNLSPTDYVVRFKSELLVIDLKDKPKESLIVRGFDLLKETLRSYEIDLLEETSMVDNLLNDNGYGVRYGREIDLVYDLFVDPITKLILQEMHEPVDLVGLFLRAAEMLTIDQHQDPKDTTGMRFKGYERIAGHVYRELALACRRRAQQPLLSKAPLDLPPQNVKLGILRDPSVEIYDGINPVKALKAQEVVTLSGVGGRSSDSLRTKATRMFHKNDKGVISEATVDSGNVGAISYFSTDPKLINQLGMVAPFDEKQDGLGRVLSTAALLSPCAENDDPKRVMFIGIQMSHVVACEGYRVLPVITGEEQVIGHRLDDSFVATAEKKGTVTVLTPKVITVTYEDGSSRSVQLGTRYAKSAGNVIPHSIVSDLKLGDVLEPGDNISYNKGFFGKVWLNPKEVFWKGGILTTVAFQEVLNTFEDSSVISDKHAEKMKTDLANIRPIKVDYNERIHSLVEEGTVVTAESILCTIESSTTASSNLFDAAALNTLKNLSNAAPKAKSAGVVEHIEVYYNGDEEEMDESLRVIARNYNRRMEKLNKALGKPEQTGHVIHGMRVDGEPLAKNQMVIYVYINNTISAGVGDKGVVGNQAKSIVGQKMSGENRTLSGRTLDALFSYRAVEARKILSPPLMGTTNTLLRMGAKRFVEIYEETNHE